jgi:hypothetical protein
MVNATSPTSNPSTAIDWASIFGAGNPASPTGNSADILLANAGNSSSDQMQSNTVRYIGVRDPDRPGKYLGQVAVQWNPRDGSLTAYGLWGSSYQLPQGSTEQQIANGRYGSLQFYPMPGAGDSHGWNNVEVLKDAITELKAGRLDASEVNRVEYWLRGTIDRAYGSDRANWDAAALANFHEVTGQFRREQEAIENRGEQVVGRLGDALSLSGTSTRQSLNDTLAAARTEQRRFGSLWNNETRDRFTRLEAQATERLRASTPGTETPIGNDGQTHSVTVPHPQFVDRSGNTYDPTTTDSQGRRWISSDELAHYLRNTGVPVTSAWLIANNPARAHQLGSEYQFQVGDTIRAPLATGTVASSGDAAPTTAAPGTTIRLLPGDGATVVGASSRDLGGGAFILTPNKGVADAVFNGDPSKLWETGLSQSSLFVTGTAAVTQLLNALGVPANSAAAQTVQRLGPNAVATYKFADGTLEIGVGGATPVAGGNALTFWNGRVEAANNDGLLPNGTRLSVNAGLVGNVGSWASRGLSNAGDALLQRSGDPRLRGVGAFLKGIGEGSGAFGTATGSNFWVGQAGRADLTVNGSGPLRVLDPGGNQLIGPEAWLGPGYLNFGDTYLARANILDQMHSGTRVWRIAEREIKAAQGSGADADTYDIPALALAHRVNQVLWDAGALPRDQFVTSTADASLRLQRLYDSYLGRAADSEGNLIPQNAGQLDKANQLVQSLVNNSGVNFGWDVLDRANHSTFGPTQLDMGSAETRYFFNPEGGFHPRRTVPGGVNDGA